MPKPSVLHIYKDYFPPVQGGIEKCIHWMAEQARGEYHVRVLVAARGRRTVDEVIDGVRVVRVGCPFRVLSTPFAPGFMGWLRRLDSDILHFHMPNPTGELASLLLHPKGRIVATYHSDIVRQKMTGLLYGPLQQRFLRRAARIMPTSQRYLETSPTLRGHRERCRVVPLGVPLKNYAETARSRSFTESIIARHPDRMRIVFLGVLRYYKGLSFLLEAMAGLRNRACLLIGGDGPERSALEAQAKRLALGDSVELLGRLGEEEGVGLLRAGDVYCLPAHLRSEAFGLSQIEAMACGLAVISTDLPTGVPEINRHGETGLVVPPANPEALREAMEHLLDHPREMLEMGRAGKERAESHYSAKAMGQAISAIYRELLDGVEADDEPALPVRGGFRSRMREREAGREEES